MAARYRLEAMGHRLLAVASANAVRADRLHAAAGEALRLARRYADLAEVLRDHALGPVTLRRIALDPAAAGELLQLLHDMPLRAPLARLTASA